MLQEKAGGQVGVVMVVVTAGGVAAVVGKVLVGVQGLECDFMAVRAEILGDGDTHGRGDLLVMLDMAGDTIQGIDLAGEDNVLGVLELTGGVRVRELGEGLAVAIHTGFGSDSGRGENVLFFLVGVTRSAFHFDLVVAVGGAPGQESCLIR